MLRNRVSKNRPAVVTLNYVAAVCERNEPHPYRHPYPSFRRSLRVLMRVS